MMVRVSDDRFRGAERTSGYARRMSASDPKRTLQRTDLLGWAYRTALRSFIKSELHHRLSGNSRAVLQTNLRLYDRAVVIRGSESHIGFAGPPP
jgi:hypothetical protein